MSNLWDDPDLMISRIGLLSPMEAREQEMEAWEYFNSLEGKERKDAIFGYYGIVLYNEDDNG
jgi:hypothetical protein